jgi:hypothetical protein
MFDLSSVRILTCVKSIVMVLRATLQPYPNNSLQQIASFVLVRMVRSCVHIIKLPNRTSKMAILKIVNLAD